MKEKDIDKNSLKEILTEEFQKSIEPNCENNWFLGPGTFLSINHKRAIEIRRQCYARKYPDPITDVYMETRRILFSKYSDVLQECINCCLNYLSEKPPKAPRPLDFDPCKSDYGSKLWIRFNLPYYMTYSNELEKVFDDIEKDEPNKLKAEYLTEKETWGISRSAIRKLIGTSLLDNGTLRFHADFYHGIESIIRYFQIPSRLLKEDGDKIKTFYDNLAEKIKPKS